MVPFNSSYIDMLKDNDEVIGSYLDDANSLVSSVIRMSVRDERIAMVIVNSEGKELVGLVQLQKFEAIKKESTMKSFIMLYDTEDADGGAYFDKFTNEFPFPDYTFGDCISLEDQFPDDVIIEMSKDYPDDQIIYDMIENISQLLIISKPFKDLLQNHDCGNVEFFPVLLKNQQDEIEKETYYLVNLFDSIDYIEKEKAADESSNYSAQDIISNKLKNIPENRDMFRSEHFANRYIVTEKLKNKIEDEKFTGMIFVPLEEYNSESYKDYDIF